MMASVNSKERLGFVMTWQIHNISKHSLEIGESLTSPVFSADSIKRTQWRLELYPEGYRNATSDHIGLFLEQMESNGVAVQPDCELSILGADGSTLHSRQMKNVVKTYGVWGRLPEFVTRDEVFVSKRQRYIPKDILTIRCRIWLRFKENQEVTHCYVRSRTLLEKTFFWKIKEFSSIQTSTERTALVEFDSIGSPALNMKFFLTSGEVKVQITQRESWSTNALECVISVLNCDGETVKSVAHGHNFLESESKIWLFPSLTTRSVLLSSPETLLKDDTLRLRCEFVSFYSGEIVDKESMHFEADASVTLKGVCSSYLKRNLSTENASDALCLADNHNDEELKTLTNDFIVNQDSKIFNSEEQKVQDRSSGGDIAPSVETMNVASTTLVNDLQRIWEQQILTDAILRVGVEEFRAHKVVLSARSTYFKAIFNGEREEFPDCLDSIANVLDLPDVTTDLMPGTIDIPGFDADAVRQMLSFMYGNTIDLDWSRATQLYRIGHKYGVEPLKGVCSSYLKRNLSIENASDALCLADGHNDEELKTFTNGFIVNQDNDIFNSEEWKRFLKTNLALGAETMLLKLTTKDQNNT